MPSSHPLPTSCHGLSRLASALDPRSALRLEWLFVGAGQQQVRRLRASVEAFCVRVWTFTMTEAWGWIRPVTDLVGHRRASPWDDGARRPSRADKRQAWRRELMAAEIHAALRALDRDGNPGRRGTVVGPRRLIVRKSRKVQTQGCVKQSRRASGFSCSDPR